MILSYQKDLSILGKQIFKLEYKKLKEFPIRLRAFIYGEQNEILTEANGRTVKKKSQSYPF